MFLILTHFIYNWCFHVNVLHCFHMYITPDNKKHLKCVTSVTTVHMTSRFEFELRASNYLPDCNHGLVNDDLHSVLTFWIASNTEADIISFTNISSNQEIIDISNTIVEGSKPNIWLYCSYDILIFLGHLSHSGDLLL